MRRLTLATIVLLAMGAGPCPSDQPGKGVIAGQGVIHQGVGPECPGAWRIDTADGRVLWPVENPEFQVDGLRVRFTARERLDMASICMAGTIVEVLTLEKE